MAYGMETGGMETAGMEMAGMETAAWKRREASFNNNGANDAEVLTSLIQELADSLKMPNGPKLNADHLRIFLKDGATRALIATATKDGETTVAGYAIYFIAPSTEFGKVFFLEDLYIRPDFRRQKLGSQFMTELKKFSNEMACDVFQWNVLANNVNAIRFYTSLGARNLTNVDGETGFSCWRIDSNQFEAIIRNSKECLPHIKFAVFSLDAENEKSAVNLIECWRSLDVSIQPTSAEKKFSLMRRFFGLCVVQAQNVPDGAILGMALFHRCAFSTWTGPYITIDNIRVRADQQRQGIGKKLVAELVKMAVDSNCLRIGWTTRADSEKKAFIEALGACNLTEKEGWLLFQNNIL
ncbi:hypothetical protein niasHS_002250 [Heterodera schachtii]|uniref:N-acetyltransferase domain-containing protein n=1 Tax=Heterodera schachtii TaxID=97005 RepID=A0ABD2KMV2_HETSC